MEEDSGKNLETEKMTLNDNKKEDEKNVGKEQEKTADKKQVETGKTQNVMVDTNKQDNKTKEDSKGNTAVGVGVAAAGLLAVSAVASGGKGCCDTFIEKFCCCFK